jgi:hypothetical protein
VVDLFWVAPKYPPSNTVHRTFVHGPPILACLGTKLDVVVRCCGSLPELSKLYLQDPKIAWSCWLSWLGAANFPMNNDKRFVRCEEPDDRSGNTLPSVKAISELLGIWCDEGDFTLKKTLLTLLFESTRPS